MRSGGGYMVISVEISFARVLEVWGIDGGVG